MGALVGNCKRLLGQEVLEVPPVLVDFAEQFLLAGGALTLADLRGLDVKELAALAAAGRRLRTAAAVQTGLAAMGPMGAAEVLAEIDGGTARDQVVAELGLALAEAEEARRGQ
jgi:hypothetical protein